jgi:hypothetical protein
MSDSIEPAAGFIALNDPGSPERRELSLSSPDISDSQFMADLQKLKDLRSFLIEQAVQLKPTESMSFKGLNLLRLKPGGRSPTQEEWESLETLTQDLFSHLSEPLRRRFLSSRLAWWVPGLTVVFGLMAILSLVMCTLTWGVGGYDRIIPLYVLWLASLGAMGSTSFIGMNALSVQDDATFELTNARLLVLRIALGSLFGLVLTLPFGFPSFVKFVAFLLSGGQDASGSTVVSTGVSLAEQSALLLLPFVLGFSTSLVIMILNQFVDAAQTLFGKKVATLSSTPSGSPRPESGPVSRS